MNLSKILLLTVGHFATDINSGALPAVLPYLATAHGFDYQTCGLFTFAFAIMSSIVQPVCGLVSDRHPSRLYIPVGILTASFAIAAIGFLSSFAAILLALLLCGTGTSIFHPEGARYANLVSARHKGLGISIFGVGGNAGYAAGPVVVAVFVGGFAVGDATIGGFGLAGMAVFAGLGLLSALIVHMSLRSWDAEMTAAGHDASVQAENDWHAFSLLSLCIISRSILFLGFTSFLPLYYANIFDFPPSLSGTLLTLFCLIGVLTNLFGGYLSDKIGHVRMVRLGLTAVIPFVLLFPLQADPLMAGILLFPVALCIYAPFSSMVLLGQKYLARSMGFASGITLGVAISIGGACTPLLGWIADHHGGLPFAMQLLTVAATVGALASFKLKKI